ncbi:nucleotide pyrophosphohydrolase [Propioniciclava soli]|uniref:Nucleotide pyrophosphohydrolase n=1 Tax=Propioniciclava soli TaxID=2775081 RepID=A0ABZ3C6R2_9ACTN
MDTADLMLALREFRERRDWAQFHAEGNLAKSIVIEAGELLECFQWTEESFDVDRVQEELADVLTYSFYLADRLDLDPGRLILEKLALTERKYPADKARGRAAKYDQL